MSRFDDALADALAPSLLWASGEDVVVHPGGDAQQARPIVAIFEPAEPDRRHDGFDGRTTSTGTLQLAADETPGADDAYLIGDELWQTDVVVPPGGGLRTVQITRTEGPTARPIGGGGR